MMTSVVLRYLTFETNNRFQMNISECHLWQGNFLVFLFLFCLLEICD